MAPPAQLEVGVVEARGLLAGDLNGFSDPFVELSVVDSKGGVVPFGGPFTTAVARKTLDPQWCERFAVGADSQSGGGLDLRAATALRFLVVDFDGLKRNDVLGVVEVPLAVLDDAELPLDGWYKVTRVPDAMTVDATGELRLTFSIPAAGDKPSVIMPPTPPMQTPNLLYVTVASGRGLLAMDSTNSSDPFVTLAVEADTPSKAKLKAKAQGIGQRQATATIAQTLKPHWDETFAFHVADPKTSVLELLAEDEDRALHDFLGRARLPLAEYLPAEGSTSATAIASVSVDVPLRDRQLQNDRDRGTIQLRLRWAFDPEAAKVARRSQRRKQARPSNLLHAFAKSVRVRDRPDGDSEDEGEDAGPAAASDDEDAEDVDGSGERLTFAELTVHRVEALPPLDAALRDTIDADLEAERTRPGAIDAYVAAALLSTPDQFVRTRVRTVAGRRDELNTSFRERLMLLIPADAAGATPATTADVLLSVMDHDNVGDDDVVAVVELRDVAALGRQHGSKPFWLNLYGAPLGAKNEAVADAMNTDHTIASAFRGRICLSIRVARRHAAAFEPKHQTRRVSPLSPLAYPPTAVYRLRAHLVAAHGLPALPSGSKWALVISCGLNELATSRRRATNAHAVEWNETEASERLVLPRDVAQLPDVFVYLCVKEGSARRIPVCFARFSARSLLDQRFQGEPKWVPLLADRAVARVRSREGFPGAALLRVGFGTIETEAEPASVWDQHAMREQVSRRRPYQLRVRLYRGRNLVEATGEAAKTGKGELELSVECSDQQAAAAIGKSESASNPTFGAVVSLDLMVPHLRYGPRVLVHVRRGGEYVGTAALPLSSAGDAGSGVVECLADTVEALPAPAWVPVAVNGADAVLGHVLLSAQLVRKTFPDEQLPAPETSVDLARFDM